MICVYNRLVILTIFVDNALLYLKGQMHKYFMRHIRNSTNLKKYKWYIINAQGFYFKVIEFSVCKQHAMGTHFYIHINH